MEAIAASNGIHANKKRSFQGPPKPLSAISEKLDKGSSAGLMGARSHWNWLQYSKDQVEATSDSNL